MTDEELVKGMMHKDEYALDCLVEQYGGIVKTIVYHHIGKLYLDECVNDVLFIIWKNIKSFNPDKSSLKNWIAAICRYKCIDYKRKYYKNIVSEIDENMPSKYTAESLVIQQETEEEINSLLSCLMPKDREIFRKRYIENESIEEISAKTNLSPSALYNRLSRGRAKLRKFIKRT